VAAVAILVATAAWLRFQGQPWWCACGGWNLSSWQVWSSHNSQHLVDPYSFSHVLHGLLFYALLCRLPLSRGARFALALGIEAGWEVLENSEFIIRRYREATMSLDYFGDSVVNTLGDILFCALGYGVAARIPVRVSVALFVATELAMIATIRDSLLLNVLMLVWPLESVKHWQMAIAGG
jgi:hypothetical protein